MISSLLWHHCMGKNPKKSNHMDCSPAFIITAKGLKLLVFRVKVLQQGSKVAVEDKIKGCHMTYLWSGKLIIQTEATATFRQRNEIKNKQTKPTN